MYSHQSPSTRILATTLSILSLTAVAPAAQVTLDGESEARAIPTRVVPPPTPPPQVSALTAPVQEIFLKDADAYYFGWTFGYDANSGRFLPMKPLFSLALSDNTGAGEYRVFYRTEFGSSIDRIERRSSYSLSGGIGMVDVCATLGQSSEAQSGTLTSGFRLGVERMYPRAAVDLINLPISTFSNEAREILSLPDPVVRGYEWHQAGFGDYIAFGYGLQAGIEVQFSMQQSDAFDSRDFFFNLNASYSGITASAQLGEAVYTAMHSKRVSVSIDGYGIPNVPALPDMATIDSPAEQLTWGTSLAQLTNGAKMRKGVYLLPVSVLSNAPDVTIPAWSDSLVSTVAVEAQNGLMELSDSTRWNRPVGLMFFLDQHTYPGTALSYGQVLRDRRSDLALSLNELKTALFTYMAKDNAQDSAYVTALLSKRNAVSARTSALHGALFDINVLKQSLPTMIVGLHENNTPSNDCNLGWHSFQVELDNVAAFHDFTIPGIMNWIRRSGSADLAHIVLREDEQCQSQWNVPHMFGPAGIEGDLHYPSIVEEQVYTTGPKAGLSKLKINLMALARGSSYIFRLECKDDFGRTKTQEIHAGWTNNGF